jgi:hypothetical protein
MHVQIYRACEQRGRIAYKRSGGSRFITHNDHWKSQIRHALYTGDRFVRCARSLAYRGSSLQTTAQPGYSMADELCKIALHKRRRLLLSAVLHAAAKRFPRPQKWVPARLGLPMLRASEGADCWTVAKPFAKSAPATTKVLVRTDGEGGPLQVRRCLCLLRALLHACSHSDIAGLRPG